MALTKRQRAYFMLYAQKRRRLRKALNADTTPANALKTEGGFAIKTEGGTPITTEA